MKPNGGNKIGACPRLVGVLPTRLIVLTLVAAVVFAFGSLPAAALTNQLKQHPSPYLALHGNDPVAWQDWGEAAVAQARRGDKLLLLSIGYFTCHWCHVMQRESYRNAEIAAYLNRHFIPVKIDRELEPALDARLSEFAENTLGTSGWPLNVFLTPDGHPLFAMLYAPPAEFLDTMTKLQQLWTQDRDALRRLARVEAKPARGPGAPRLDKARVRGYTKALTRAALERADPIHGGFGEQSKFPSVPALTALLAVEQPPAELTDFLRRTLDAMADQGLRDHLGGGFFRYTVDPGWKTPHFEKMLYDNALLAPLYLRAAQRWQDPRYERVARETLDFMARDLGDTSGAFIAALSAVDNDGVEGGYYLWSNDALAAVLTPAELQPFRLAYGLTDAAPFDAGYLPIPVSSVADVAQRLALPIDEVQASLDRARGKLKAARDKRQLPRDTKRLAGWNGLALSAFAQAAKITGDPRYHALARGVRDYLMTTLWDGRRLRRAVEDGREVGAAALEDYAYVAAGLRHWAELTGAADDYEQAAAVVRQAWARFYDKRGWRLAERTLLAANHGEDVIADSPLPSPSAVILDTSLALAARGDDSLRRRALSALNSADELLRADPFWYASQIAAMNRAVSSVAPARKAKSATITR